MSAVDQLDALPPWEAAQWFQQIKETTVSLAMATVKQLIAGDPLRVALIIDTPGGVAISASVNPALVTGQGIFVSNTRPLLTLLFRDLGPLVQQAWYGLAAGATSVTVYSITLRAWPDRVQYRRRRRPHEYAPPTEDRAGDGG